MSNDDYLIKGFFVTIHESKHKFIIEEILDKDNEGQIKKEVEKAIDRSKQNDSKISENEKYILIHRPLQKQKFSGILIIKNDENFKKEQHQETLMDELMNVTRVYQQVLDDEERKKEFQIKISEILIKWNDCSLVQVEEKIKRMQEMDIPLFLTGSVSFIIVVYFAFVMIYYKQ